MNMPAIRILVVDDELAIRRALRPPLLELGFQVAEASRGEEALQLLRAGGYDVVLLDINMPGIGGIETLRRIRNFAPRLPILMLTVRDQEEDKVAALDLGADDYVTKPFSMRELIARIRTAIRRMRAPERAEDAPIVIGEIRLDPVKRVVTKRGEPIHLTRKEFDILHCLMIRA
jgi:two-component system KDP operon response regulator KdpE